MKPKCITGSKLAITIVFVLICAFAYAQPLQPDAPTWQLTLGKISNTASITLKASPSNPVTAYQFSLYKDGLSTPIHTYTEVSLSPAIEVDTQYSQDCLAEMAADFDAPANKYEKYYVKVVATNSGGSTESAASGFNAKGLESLSITGYLEFGTDPGQPVFNRLSSTSFEHLAFVFSPQSSSYNHAIRTEVESIKLDLPSDSANNPNTYKLTGVFNGTDTFYSQSSAYGSHDLPLYLAQTSAGRDANGNPNSTAQNNVITIVVNEGTGFEGTYVLSLRRRILCLAASLSAISPTPQTISSATAFSSTITGGDPVAGPKPSEVNGDTIASIQKLNWELLAQTGTAYFEDSTLYPLSNGDLLVRVRTADGSNLERTSASAYTITSQSAWYPHLGRMEIRSPRSPFQLLRTSPPFSADSPSGTIYSVGILDDYSTVTLSTMAPPDCQIYLNGARVSNQASLVLRMQPQTIANPYNDYVFTVESPNGSRTYTLRAEREVEPRLRYGRSTGNAPYLSAPEGEWFGMNNPEVNQAFTVQAWVRWTVDPFSVPSNQWATIVSMDNTSDRGQFWLQHNSANTAFEFAMRTQTSETTAARSHIASTTVPQRGIWYLVTGVWDGSLLRLYVNDTMERSVARTGTFNLLEPNPKLWVGRSPSTGFRLFSGNVKSLKMWVGTARSATEIANDFAGIIGGTSPTHHWPLEETETVTTLARSAGSVDLTMQEVLSTDFVQCCANNMPSGNLFLMRPTRMDLSSAESESVVFVQAQGYTATDPKLILAGPATVAPAVSFELWNPETSAWTVPTGVGSGVGLIGNPASSTRFWMPIRRNDNTTGLGRYADDGEDTGYNGSIATVDGQTYFNTIAPLPAITAMTSPFTLSGTVTGTVQYPTTAKYVVLGYDLVEAGTLIAASSTPISSSKEGKGTVTFNLKSDTTLRRIEIRTLDDILIIRYLNPDGWSTTGTLDPQTLPVVLSGFQVLAWGSFARVQWITASETNIMGFRVYRNSEAVFGNATLISPLIAGTNSSSTQSYIFVDKEILHPGNWHYWLEIVEMDGTNQLFGPVNVIIDAQTEASPELPLRTGISGVIPNPFSVSTQIKYALAERSPVEISIYNLRGQLVKSWTLPSQARGSYDLAWSPTQNLPSGLYLLQFRAGNHWETKRITIIN